MYTVVGELFVIQWCDSTEGLHGPLGHIPVSSGATAVLVFCGFALGSVIINVISCTHVPEPLHTMAHIHILFLEESYYYTTNYEPCRSVALQLGVVLVTEKDILKDIACTHSYSFAMKAYERSGEQANRLSSTFKAFCFAFEVQVTECSRNSSKGAA